MKAFLDVDRRAHLRDPELYRRFYDRDLTPGKVFTMPAEEPRLKWVLSHIGPTDDVIDIGCHKGEMTQWIPDLTYGRVLGIDISETAIWQARAYNNLQGMQRPVYWHGEATRIDTLANSFDVAILCEILEHVPDPAVVIREAERVVRPGGKIIVTTPVDAIEIDRAEASERDRLTGFALDMHVREYDPAVELRGKTDLVVERGYEQNVKARFRGIDQWLAVYTVSKTAGVR